MLINLINDIEKELRNDIKKAVEGANFNLKQLPEIQIEVPRVELHGDYASNIAMVLAGSLHKAPRNIAESIVSKFTSTLVDEITVAGPGFINFTLNNDWLYRNTEMILKSAGDYGKTNFGEGKSVQIEFVSANPTGPLHVGHSRGAVVGDVLANIMDAAGYNVEKEYYINDAGNQMDILARSTLLRYKQVLGMEVKLDENSYAGDYLIDIGRELKELYDNKILDKSEEEQLEICREFAYKKMLKIIEEDLEGLGIEFDNWFSERQLHQGKIIESIEILRENGYIYEKDEALWFKSSDFGDDKDRVVIKSDGKTTYLAADIAYHLNKLSRGFDILINVWGADHHGYIPRMKSVIQAFDYAKEKLEILIVQLVSLLRDGKKVAMSKRSGEFVTMRELVKEVGRDAARYFYIMRSTDSHFDFDLDLAKEESNNNPVYYIQYAHARICSILDNVEGSIGDIEELDNMEGLFKLLLEKSELDLMKMLARFPEEVKMSAGKRQTHHIAAYAHELAGVFHLFYNQCRIINTDERLSSARLLLVRATKQVLENVLKLLGINAPQKM